MISVSLASMGLWGWSSAGELHAAEGAGSGSAMNKQPGRRKLERARRAQNMRRAALVMGMACPSDVAEHRIGFSRCRPTPFTCC